MARGQHPLLGDRDWLKGRIEAGRSWVEIAKDAGLTSETISLVAYYVRKHGLQGQSRLRRGTPVHPVLGDRDWLKARIDGGLSQLEIADELGIERTKASIVAYYVKKHGLQKGLGRSEQVKAAFAEKYPNGRRGAEAGHWKGGRMQVGNGYIRLHMPDHPQANHAGYVYEHRWVMEQKLGRMVQPEEIVDHIDRNRSNNAPENLQLHATRAEHVKDHFRARDQVAALKAENAVLRAKLGE